LSIDRRRALLYAALAAVRVRSTEPEIHIVRTWLDTSWGLGAIVVGMRGHDLRPR